MPLLSRKVHAGTYSSQACCRLALSYQCPWKILAKGIEDLKYSFFSCFRIVFSSVGTVFPPFCMVFTPVFSFGGRRRCHDVVFGIVVDRSQKKLSKDIQNFELHINDENITVIEPSSIRKIIAERTTQTKNEVPHFYLTIETRMDKLINLRKKINSNSDIKISFNDLIVKACAIAIAKNPETNISWVNGKIHQYKNIDIAIAVALKEGLITPIVKEADTKGLSEISTEIKSLVKKANQNKLLPEEYSGGSITISNLGMFGITEFQAIINPPQSSIIAIGSIIEKPVVNSGSIEIGHTMKSTISADHRSLDGAVAAKLLKDFSDILEDPFQIWLNSLDMEVI